MDWVLSCTEPKRVCWGPQYTASLVKFPSTSAGSSRPHAGATPVVPRARSPPASARLALARRSGNDQGDRARAHVILRVDQFPQQLRVINITSDVPRECRVNSDPLRPVFKQRIALTTSLGQARGDSAAHFGATASRHWLARHWSNL